MIVTDPQVLSWNCKIFQQATRLLGRTVCGISLRYNICPSFYFGWSPPCSWWNMCWIHPSLLVGGLEHGFDFSIQLGIGNMLSSQLTNSIIFQRGRSTTKQLISDDIWEWNDSVNCRCLWFSHRIWYGPPWTRETRSLYPGCIAETGLFREHYPVSWRFKDWWWLSSICKYPLSIKVNYIIVKYIYIYYTDILCTIYNYTLYIIYIYTCTYCVYI